MKFLFLGGLEDKSVFQRDEARRGLECVLGG